MAFPNPNCAAGLEEIMRRRAEDRCHVCSTMLVHGDCPIPGCPGSGIPEKAMNKQVGGDHYRDMAIQPVEFIHRNSIPYIEGCAIDCLCHWRKNGVQDLEKAKHFIDLLIEMEKSNDPKWTP